jgi:hypothetical protein
MKPLTHFYHVFADGDWMKPATEHIEELAISGLLDNLDDMFLGIVGTAENRNKVKRELPGVVVAEAESGWEQVTLHELHDYSKVNDCYIFYAHTKGAWSRTVFADEWRVSMTHNTVTKWPECVEALGRVDAAGPYWLKSDEPEHIDHDHFFAGNFWWARSDYLRRLPLVGVDNRFQAEGWVGLGNPSVHETLGGYPYWGNFWQPPS